jgi:hypothetical protein
MAKNKSARHRAKLKAKFKKKRARETGQMKKRKAGGRLKYC